MFMVTGRSSRSDLHESRGLVPTVCAQLVMGSAPSSGAQPSDSGFGHEAVDMFFPHGL